MFYLSFKYIFNYSIVLQIVTGTAIAYSQPGYLWEYDIYPAIARIHLALLMVDDLYFTLPGMILSFVTSIVKCRLLYLVTSPKFTKLT